MTRIGFLIPEFPGQTHAFFIRERQELKKLGVDTQLISTRAPISSVSNAKHQWASEAAKETIYLSPLSLGSLLQCVGTVFRAGPAAWLRCAKIIFGASDMGLKDRLKMFGMIIAGAYLKQLCQKQNLKHVHIHSCANSANVGLFSKLLNGPNYSITLHGPMHDYGNNQANKWRHATYCIIITNDLLNEVHTNLAGIPLPPLFLAPMGVNIEDFQRDKEYQSYQKGDLLKLVSCGRLNFVKAHDDLIRVVAALKKQGISTQLNICGANDSLSDVENYYDQLIKLRAEMDVVEEVNFLGSVSENQVKDELQTAHFFCLASLKEPLGVATMEAMAMEIPAIVTRSPGVSEMVNTGIDGILVEPRSPEQFVEVINTLIENPEQAHTLAKAGRKKVIAKFHSGVSAAKIAEGLTL